MLKLANYADTNQGQEFAVIQMKRKDKELVNLKRKGTVKEEKAHHIFPRREDQHCRLRSLMEAGVQHKAGVPGPVHC